MKNDYTTELGGRPTKLTKKLLDTLRELVNDDKVVFLTNHELLTLLNQRLPKKDRVVISTWKNWNSMDLDSLGNSTFKINLVEFRNIIEEALIREKLALFGEMRNQKTQSWQRLAWILQRKWSNEWSEKSTVKHVGDDEAPIRFIIKKASDTNQ